MEIINHMVCFFAAIGIIFFIVCVVIPLLDALAYGLGYAVFHILCTNRQKAMNHPLKYIFIIVKWYIVGTVDRMCGFGIIEKYKIGKKEWKPYFHYRMG